MKSRSSRRFDLVARSMPAHHAAPWHLPAAVALGAILAACGSDGGADDDGAGASGSGGSGASGGGSTCYDVDVNDVNDGESACGPEICDAGTYCMSNVGICDPGCLSELNCAHGQMCDLSNPTTDAEGREVGLCRAPGKAHEVPCPTGAGGGNSGGCIARCAAKAMDCDAPSNIATQYCTPLCQDATEQQIECIEGETCAALGEAFEQGEPICGLGGSTSGEVGGD